MRDSKIREPFVRKEGRKEGRGGDRFFDGKGKLQKWFRLKFKGSVVGVEREKNAIDEA